jgi:3-methyladenine DNA glycosylase AlkD
MTYKDKHLQQVRTLLAKKEDSKHAFFHKAYHKSSKKFYGLRSAGLTDVFRSVFPKSNTIPKEEVMLLARELWESEWFEEQAIGIMLLERYVKEFTPTDLPYFKRIVGECEGWAMLDWISTHILGIMAMNYGDPIYKKVRTWTKSKHLWTRRAAILIHCAPARKQKLRAEYALPTFEELLHEKEFFIRKAIGWALREIARHYPEITFEFLKEHKNEASGLTMREGARRLPERMRKELLGK